MIIYLLPFIKFSKELDKNLVKEMDFINKKCDLHYLCEYSKLY